MKFGKKFRNIIAILACTLVLSGCEDLAAVSDEAFGLGDSTTSPGTETAAFATPETESVTKDTAESVSSESTASFLAVHYVDVGQGDCTLIECGGEYMLIDAGDNDKGTLVQSYLLSHGVTSLKYFIITHSDADHCGGADVIMTKFPCGTVFIKKEERDTSTYRDVWDTINYLGINAVSPAVGDTYTLGGASFAVLGPAADYDTPNDNSIAILLAYGECRFLFTGDAEGPEEQAIIDCGIDISGIDVYKCGHHGSSTSSGAGLLDVACPKSAVISCGEGNDYGHPSTATLNNLRERGVDVYRTDEQGTIIAVSDGSSIGFSCSPSETWKAGEAEQTYY